MKAAAIMQVVSREGFAEAVTNSPTLRRSRIIVRKGKSFVPVLINDVAICYTCDKVTFVQLFNGSKFFADYNLNDLMYLLDPSQFFRVNRKTIVNIEAIKEYRCISFSKIIIDLVPLSKSLHQVLVSQFTAPSFKKWIHNQ